MLPASHKEDSRKTVLTNECTHQKWASSTHTNLSFSFLKKLMIQKHKESPTRLCAPISSALGRWREENQEFKATLSYTVAWKPA